MEGVSDMGADGATETHSLRARLAVAEATICALQEQFAGFDVGLALELGLTRAEAAMLGCLMRNEVVSRKQLSTLLGSLRPEKDAPDPSGMSIYIQRLRKKLQPWRIVIDVQNTVGWHLRADSRARLDAMTAERADLVAREPRHPHGVVVS